ncbi:hypothetical protein M5X00_26420 [Paenibacillus alvei]|uniref:hypothetical protein n=1 Tax=Paenibacillus alvei TaxID=44250 RepID=UPI0002884332|nr:hypothetical protein [Paenibacillus alvei]EJW14062.1 hypothetical protein PAV_141p01680 [Paenibacillus alvei DSM 29]MCY9544886.1 hypothetical protein [Paenibacillus alvei]MCY9707787.1 hypothetical protein [Paenibacillus alvei]MCY9757768.1 hypothetical protein [Paenibacillus alvei]MEC0082701.1 hypothetical protein [Paenibacillus alvei]
MNTTKTNNAGKTFEEILNGLLGDMEKKFAMAMAIEQAKEKMNEELQQMGDMVMGSIEVEECPCERNCGAVKVSAEFTAMTFTQKGIEVKEGKIENILSFNE